MIKLAILPEMDETLGSAMQSGFKRIRSWRVPPNWSRGDWFEELASVGTAAAWQAVCEFVPERGVPLAGFGYCRMITRCLSRYRKEWRYALHLVASDSCEKETTSFKQPGLAASSAARAGGTYRSNDDLRGAVGALLPEQRRLIEQLFWEDRTEAEVADALGTNQSTISRRKQAILHGLRMKLGNRNDNHQVLAYGYDLDGTDLVMHLYDPNNPDDDTVTMSLSIADPQHTTPVTNSVVATVWCFFQPVYAFSLPPSVKFGKRLTVAQNADGRLEVVYIGTNDALYHTWQTTPGGAWAGEAVLGGSAKQITVGRNQSGALEVFYVGTDDYIYHNWQTTPGGAWAGESLL